MLQLVVLVLSRYTKTEVLFSPWDIFERLAAAATAASPTFTEPQFAPSEVVNVSAAMVQRQILLKSPNGYLSVRCTCFGRLLFL